MEGGRIFQHTPTSGGPHAREAGPFKNVNVVKKTAFRAVLERKCVPCGNLAVNR